MTNCNRSLAYLLNSTGLLYLHIIVTVLKILEIICTLTTLVVEDDLQFLGLARGDQTLVLQHYHPYKQ